MDKAFVSEVSDLIRKYSAQGPYYTSYPTGQQWTTDFGPADYERGLTELIHDNSAVPLSLYLHVPFCKRRCRFCFCFTEVTHDREKINAFLDVLFLELSLLRQKFEALGVEPNIREVHLGGGSPSYLDIEQLESVIDYLQRFTNIQALDEFTLEADAITVTPEKLLAYHDLGINRLSFGIQDFDARVQEAIGRVQSSELIAELMAPEIRRHFKSINFDLMYGLPFQSRQSIRETMSKVVDLSPDRTAIYSYYHKPQLYPHQGTIRIEDLPDEIEKTLIFAEAAQILTQNGYEFIGIDHFSKPSDDLATAKNSGTLLRHFMGYTAGRTRHLLGVGPTSISGFGNCYAHNVYSMEDYTQAVFEGRLPILRGCWTTEDDRIRWSVISRFMAYMSVNYSDIEKEYGIDFSAHFADELSMLESFVEDGLVVETKSGFRATDMGRFFARHVCAIFDQYASLDGRKAKAGFVPAIQRSHS